jgi:hypothetical protein
MAEIIEYKYNANTKDATKNVEKLGGAMKDTNKDAKESKEGISEMADAVGKIGGPIQGAIDGIKNLGGTLKALMANPIVLLIGAIVASLTALYKAFTSTKEGGEKMNQVFAGLSAVMNVLRDVANKITGVLIDMFNNPMDALKSFGKLLYDQVVNRLVGLVELVPNLAKSLGHLFKGEFTKAGEVAFNAVTKITTGVEDLSTKLKDGMNAIGAMVKEMSNEAKIAADIEKKLQKLADAERQLTIDKAKQQKQIEANRAIADDENKSLEERRQALARAMAMEEKLIKRETNIASQRYALIKKKNDLTAETTEGVEAESEALTKLYELQNQLAAKRNEKTKADRDLAIQIEQQKLVVIQTAYQGIVETYDRAAESQRQLRDDEMTAIDERIKANEILAGVLEKGQKEERDNIQQRIDGLKSINQQYGESPERLNEIMALTEELKGVDAKYEGLKSEQLTNRNGLLKEQKDLTKSVGDTQLEVDKIIAESNVAQLEGSYKALEAEQKLIDDTYNANAKALDDQMSQYKIGTQAYQDALNARLLLDAQYTADSNAQAKKREEFAQQVETAKLQYAQNGLTAISGLLDAFAGEDEARQRKAFKLNKAISLANAVLSTYEAVNAALATKTELFPYERFVRASLALATGLANVKKITDTKFSPSGETAPAGGGTPVVGPSVGIVGGQINNNVQMAGLMAQNKPQRAYVVGQDVNTAQSLDRHIQQNATL